MAFSFGIISRAALGHLDKGYPCSDCCALDETVEMPRMFDLVEETLDASAHCIDLLANCPLYFAVRFDRDNRVDVASVEVNSSGITVVVFVGNNYPWTRHIPILLR